MKRKLLIAPAVFLFLFGLGVLLYPTIQTAAFRQAERREIRRFEEYRAEGKPFSNAAIDAPEDILHPENPAQTEPAEELRAFPELWAACVEYNAQLVEKQRASLTASGMDSPASQKDRVDYLIMMNEKPIGEIALKHIDETARQCELSIHMQNDSVKSKGYGTQAERLILKYAFQTLGMTAVIADSVLKNKRSQHTLEKVGFQETGRDDTFVYYKISKSDDRAEISIKKADKKDLKKIYDSEHIKNGMDIIFYEKVMDV